MPYNKFTLRKAIEDFGLTLAEPMSFLPQIQPVVPSDYLNQALERSLGWAIAVGSEKARSEGIIAQVLLEVREVLHRQVSLFSGEDFTVDPELELTGRCDFLVSRSSEQLFIQAPAVIVVEAKKEDTKSGLGQCVAEMVAAQKFNHQRGQRPSTIYGCVSSGTAWRFLKLEQQQVTINLMDHPLPPVDMILGVLVWMARSEPE